MAEIEQLDSRQLLSMKQKPLWARTFVELMHQDGFTDTFISLHADDGLTAKQISQDARVIRYLQDVQGIQARSRFNLNDHLVFCEGVIHIALNQLLGINRPELRGKNLVPDTPEARTAKGKAAGRRRAELAGDVLWEDDQQLEFRRCLEEYVWGLNQSEVTLSFTDFCRAYPQYSFNSARAQFKRHKSFYLENLIDEGITIVERDFATWDESNIEELADRIAATGAKDDQNTIKIDYKSLIQYYPSLSGIPSLRTVMSGIWEEVKAILKKKYGLELVKSQKAWSNQELALLMHYASDPDYRSTKGVRFVKIFNDHGDEFPERTLMDLKNAYNRRKVKFLEG